MIYKISRNEIVKERYSLQAIERLLKEKGAPVNGFFYLTPDTKNYIWERYPSSCGNYICFSVEPIIKPPTKGE